MYFSIKDAKYNVCQELKDDTQLVETQRLHAKDANVPAPLKEHIRMLSLKADTVEAAKILRNNAGRPTASQVASSRAQSHHRRINP